ncbi:DNA-binding protein [uncultured Thiodictyon sp.]|uniref:DNA-binding protein n=1 Tax=uncultured Thiodictyon sp. TaxID=1846217 RepID=UPI0025F96279|nr:DNA-binding protein [uncultured Thiodictyon sp.]
MATDSPIARVVVCDAGPLIHLDELDSLRLLCDFPSVLVPEVVWAEAERHRPHIFAMPNLPFVRVRPQHPPRPALAALSRLMPLHAGETQALQIAEEQGADLLLTDDTAARLAARELQLSVHGTLGILLRAIRRGQRSTPEMLVLLRAIPERSTLHIKPSLLLEVIAQVERTVG